MVPERQDAVAEKTLSIIVKAIDQATSPLRTVLGTLGSVGDKASTEGKRIETTLKGIHGTMQTVLGVVAGFGVFSLAKAAVGGLVNTLEHTTKNLEDIGKAADRLGLPVELMAELKYQAYLADVDFQTLAGSIGGANDKLAEFVATGAGRAKAAIEQMGLSLRDTNGNLRGMEELLPEIFDAINKFPATEQGFLVKKIFGDDSGGMLRIIRAGGDEFKRMADEARRLGVVFSPGQIAAASAYQDAVKRVSQAWEGLKAVIVLQVAPALTEVFNKMAGWIASVPDIAKGISKAFAEAMNKDSIAGATIRGQVLELMQGLQGIVLEGVKGMVLLGYTAIASGLPAAIGMILPIAKAAGKRLGIAFVNAVTEPAVKAMNWFIDLDNASRIMFGDITHLTSRIKFDSMPVSLATESMKKDISDSLDELNNAMNVSGQFGDQWRKAWNTSIDGVGRESDRVITSMNNLIGLSGIVASHAIQPMKEMKEAMLPPKTAETEWDRIFGAIARGWKNVKNRVKPATDVITDLTEKTIEGLAGGLSNAFVDAVSGVKTFGEAVRDMALGVLKQIMQITSQWLIMKAIMGIVGGASTSGMGPGASGLAAAGTAGMSRGGWFDGRGIPHYADGGVVPGPDLGRDSFLAALRGNEGVLNPMAMRNMGTDELHYRNRGGVPSGGTSIVSNVTVNIMGGGGGMGGGLSSQDLMAIKKASADGVMEAIQARPTYRNGLRAALR